MSIRVVLVLFTMLFLLAACFEDKAMRVLEEQGFTDIELKGVAIIGCGESDDPFHNKRFTATNTAGRRINGRVCGSAMKGWTIRYD